MTVQTRITGILKQPWRLFYHTTGPRLLHHGSYTRSRSVSRPIKLPFLDPLFPESSSRIPHSNQPPVRHSRERPGTHAFTRSKGQPFSPRCGHATCCSIPSTQADAALSRVQPRASCTSWLPYTLIDQVLVAAAAQNDLGARGQMLRRTLQTEISNRVKRMQKTSKLSQ